MSSSDPMHRSKEDYQNVIDKIKSDSAVGIDAQFTHAIIIDYLQQISDRLDKVEEQLKGEK